ncbi:unnamed protein product [Chrysodeixis includens]|uniref:BPTI/Kunitz inhibitor domain-containing protein n=1 Tax=Chrysodeixis includens TaxID=689277 RepID=A0A9N8L667_CHRIL|nr:unnamed protein product [Chrysodeixis includens]
MRKRTLCPQPLQPKPVFKILIKETVIKQGLDDHVCSLEIDPGLCLRATVRFGYDVAHRKCVGFIFGGCGGNKNSFSTLEDCQRFFHITTYKVPKDIKCLVHREAGRCLAYIPSFAYDANLNECVPFVYGGCGGNDNRFETKEECEEDCKPE